jgi:hypothetical protein
VKGKNEKVRANGENEESIPRALAFFNTKTRKKGGEIVLFSVSDEGQEWALL